MCSVDTTLPLMMVSTTKLVLTLISAVVVISVWLKGVAWLFNLHVMVGAGTPVEVQEMSTLPPSLTVTTLAPPLTMVLASTARNNIYT